MASDPAGKAEPASEAGAVTKPSEPPRTSQPPRKKKSKRPKPPVPTTEREIDSPKRQTIGMLGVLGVMTLVMHVLARGACNYHPPKETRDPRAVTTAELARDPKNAALEFQQRWATRDFAGALELAGGSAAEDLAKAKAACDKACLAERPKLKKRVLTTSVLLENSPLFAAARVTTLGLPGGRQTYLVRLERSGSIWKATSRVPTDEPPATPPSLSPAPSGSAVSPHG